MVIKMSSVLPIENPERYKMHLAHWNGKTQPLDDFVKDRSAWESWNTWRSSKNEFNRQFILALIEFYPEPDVWLFGGIFEVLDRGKAINASSYKIRMVEDGQLFVGRLKLRLKRPARSRAFRLENYYADIEVSELLKEPYTGEVFCGYENICHDFTALETIFKTGKPDWKAALENVKGVYLIVDKKTGRKYVGSAYGDSGLWARWACYMGTGHGWTDELTKLIKEEGIDYARANFRFSLLEYRPARTDDNMIIKRESYWKKALNTQGNFGYNKN